MNNNFQYSCIGDNTPENREHLEKLGYKNISRHCSGKYIETTISGGYSIFNNDLVLSVSSKCYVNNSALFRAVTAMRDDSDYMQWFVFDRDVYDLEDEYTKGDTLLFKKGDWYLCRHYGMIGKTITHKATLAELKEHFK